MSKKNIATQKILYEARELFVSFKIKVHMVGNVNLLTKGESISDIFRQISESCKYDNVMHRHYVTD